MMAKLWGAFLAGAVLAGGLAWYLHPGQRAQPAPEPKPAPVAESAVAEPVPVVETPKAPEPVAPAPKPKPAVSVRVPPAAALSSASPAAAAAPAPATAEVRTPEPERPLDLPIPMQKVAVEAPHVAVVEEKPAGPRPPRTAVIPAGTLITVRLNETLASNRSEEGYTFRATLDAPLVVDGLVLAERGTPQAGKITGVSKATRAKGRASLALELTELTTSDGQKVEIKTDTFHRLGTTESKKSTGIRAGVGAGIGAAIGAAAGGGIGAAIGAAAGAVGGAGSVLVTKGQEAQLPSETRISFRLKEPVTLTEKI
jgi:hypothetical protein